MEIGAILTASEVETIRRRLLKIQLGKGTPRRTSEQARLIICAISQAERRARRQIKKTEPKLF